MAAGAHGGRVPTTATEVVMLIIQPPSVALSVPATIAAYRLQVPFGRGPPKRW